MKQKQPTLWMVLLAALLVQLFGVQCNLSSNLSQARTQTKKPTDQQKQLPVHLQTIDASKVDWTKKTDQYWKKVLTPTQYQVCRKAGTERPFTGKHLKNKKPGYFTCSSCGHVLFDATTKFESGTGWPSFYQPHGKGAVRLKLDRSYGMVRVEVVCARCNAHLGHVFDDGPKPTGKRYCINSVCLDHISSLPRQKQDENKTRK